ncbi:hypothetical protein KM043_014223 [Ampulex compressa]|nr:hypothetical protein KM043_014223 [Ampulex compressa]
MCTGFDGGSRDTGLLPLPLAAFALSSFPLLLPPRLARVLLLTASPNLGVYYAVHVGVPAPLWSGAIGSTGGALHLLLADHPAFFFVPYLPVPFLAHGLSVGRLAFSIGH